VSKRAKATKRIYCERKNKNTETIACINFVLTCSKCPMRTNITAIEFVALNLQMLTSSGNREIVSVNIARGSWGERWNGYVDSSKFER
jgi:hypothetical protein